MDPLEDRKAPAASELSGYTTTSEALPYALSPLDLLLQDLLILLKNIPYIPGIVWPFIPVSHNPLNELSLTWQNAGDIIFHTFLIFTQLGFIASIPLCLFLPMNTFLFYFIGFLVANFIFCLKFNGSRTTVFSARPNWSNAVGEGTEKWIFINGVAVGHHWLQNNIQLLANTFRREIVAVHNPTSGIIFDIIECLIQRDFSYNTPDVRDGYAYVKDQLTNSQISKVVLILHSQGGIEGGMIIDWLLADLPESSLAKLEVYTFGNAANHFNNPVRRSAKDSGGNEHFHQLANGTHDTESRDYYRAIGHIEHYANTGDFVSRYGVLYFAQRIKHRKSSRLNPSKDTDEAENRYVGTVFKRKGSGHMFNQHYLANMFTMDDNNKVADRNDFMDSYAKVDKEYLNNNLEMRDRLSKGKRLTIGVMSRLWKYRNGGSPAPLK